MLGRTPVATAEDAVVAVMEDKAEKSTLYPLVALPVRGGSSTGHRLNWRLILSQYKSMTIRRNWPARRLETHVWVGISS